MNENNSDLPVLVSGGGIGGRAVALASVSHAVWERPAARDRSWGPRAVIDQSEWPENLHGNAASLWAGPKCRLVHGWNVNNCLQQG